MGFPLGYGASPYGYSGALRSHFQGIPGWILGDLVKERQAILFKYYRFRGMNQGI
jgi:hypothetical protein